MHALIYVWIGSALPDWARVSLGLSKSTSGVQTILLCSRAIGSVPEVSRQYFLEDFYSPHDFLSARYEHASAQFRDGFWIKVIERFFILEQFVRMYGYTNFFHAELDQLIFNIADLGSKLDEFGFGCFCPRDDINRGIASLIYVNDTGALKAFTDLALTKIKFDFNDMDLLGELLRHSNKFFSLPTEAVFASDKANLPFKCVAQNFTGGIFDAAAIGQFLFGIDRRNCSGRLFNGFENENRGCNLWALKYEIDLQNGLATIGQRGDSIKTNRRFKHEAQRLT